MVTANTLPRGQTRSFNTSRAAYFFILPASVMYTIFFFYPFLSSIYLSLTDWNGVQDPNFIGLDNYRTMLDDDLMWKALGHNVIWVIIGTSIPIFVGLMLATLLWSGTRGQLIFRTIYFMPMVMSSVIIGIIWSWIYNPLIGIVNRWLADVGLESWQRGWLGDPDITLYAVLVAAMWGYLGFCVVILFAGLQKVDLELVEAATIDGANPVQRFFYIIIPQLRHVLTMLVAFTLIGGFNVFDIVFIMTEGGPANATELIATHTYYKSFRENQVGYGAALSMVMTILALVTTIIFMALRERGQEVDV